MNDPIARLRHADPAPESNLAQISSNAWARIQDGTTAEPRTVTASVPSTEPAHRGIGRRGILAAGAAVLLAGGGAAYAAITSYTKVMQVVCLPDGPGEQEIITPVLTGDPIADCASAMESQGLSPIADPVAYGKPSYLYVVPGDDVPTDVEPLTTQYAIDPKMVELEASVADFVDGGMAPCRTVAEQQAWAQGELERLALRDWSVRLADGAVNDHDSPCSTVLIDNDQSLLIHATPADDTFSGGTWELADELRAQISESCLSLEEARAIVSKALAARDAGPSHLTTIEDQDVDCARVDAEIGGDIQITVYGPSTTG